MAENCVLTKDDLNVSSTCQRFDYLDIAKGIGVLLVLFGHLLQYGGKVSTFIFSFHMPLFYIISGMCFNPEKDSSFESFVIRRFKSLVIPYFLYCIVGLVFTCAIPGMMTDGMSIDAIANDVFYLAAPNIFHVGQIWFLIDLFFVEIFGFTLNKLVFSKSNKKIVSVITILLLIYCGANTTWVSVRYFVLGRFPWMLDTAITATVFYVVGFLIRRWGVAKTLKRCNKALLSIFAIVLYGLLAHISINYLGWVNIANLMFNNLFLYYTCAFIGALATICISEAICGLTVTKPLKILGRNSLFLFSIHSIFLELLAILATRVYGYQIMFGLNMPQKVIVLGGAGIAAALVAFGCIQNYLRRKNIGRKSEGNYRH
jgi:fucose 4-O-acetylase-like acetyltransferase